MKRLVLLMAGALMTTLAFAQKVSEKDVPQAVKSSFQKIYPNAKDVKWEKEGSNYEVNFDFSKTEYSVLFDANGNLIETEVEIPVDQLPKGIFDYVATHYKGQKIKEAAKITDSKGVVTYEAEIKGLDLLFDSQGTFIKEVKE